MKSIKEFFLGKGKKKEEKKDKKDAATQVKEAYQTAGSPFGGIARARSAKDEQLKKIMEEMQ